ncbi:thioredoxin family protein [Bacillus anthracis]|uniref:thioredoxin family protein n=1 Tax=Bacillus anthracis TaxID=1392 RepID=UPI003D1D92B1
MKKIIISCIIIITSLIIIISLTNKKENKTTQENYYQNQISVEELKNNLSNQEEKFIYFYQTDCHYCKKVSPIIVPMSKKMNFNMEVLNLQDQKEGWKEFKIEGTPTIIHYKYGKEINRIEGEYPKEEFEKWFKNNSK